MLADILYYPSIEFQSEDWIKRSLLYWDRVCRIVPDGYTPNDSDLVRSLISEGLIKDISVSEGQLRQAATEFLKRFRNSWLIQNLREGKLPPDTSIRLHRDKVTERLRPLFEEIGIRLDNDWMSMPEGYAGYYMNILANTVAAQRNIVTGTDNADCWSITPYFKERGNFDEFVYNKNAEGVYSMLLLEDVFPSNVRNIPLGELVGFSIGQREKKKLLREKIGELIERLREVSSRDQLEDESSQLIKEIDEAKREYVYSCHPLKSGVIESSLAVGVPTAGTLVSLGGGLVNFGVTFALSAYAAIKDFSKIKNKRDNSYQSYLVGIDKSAVRALPGEANQNLEELIND